MRRRYIVMTVKRFASIDINNYLTIEALEDGLTASLSLNACEYCVDGDGDWKSLAANTTTESINAGQTLSFRGELSPTSSNGIGTFTVNKKFNLKGNCMSMLFGDAGKDNYSLNDKDYAFYNLFKNCTTLKSVSFNFLPATTLGWYCYQQMFQGCTSLTTAPELPATTLSIGCYKYMFGGCTSLVNAPALPATTLGEFCYSNMFNGCTNLTTAPELPATTVAYNCYQYMFFKCINLTTAPELPATTLTSHCYFGMFYGCTSLTTAPELPATTLADYCYKNMFYSCTSLTTAPELPATTLAQSCYEEMFYNCTSLTTAPELPATTLTKSCYSDMFRICTSLTTAPELPATTLTNYCYDHMFSGCTKLNYIKMLATDISASNCLNVWVSGVASTGTFVKNPAMNSLPTGTSGIPSGWTVVNDGEESVNTDNYLTIEALEDGLTASLSTNACEYCVDGDGNWKTLSAGNATQSINSGQTLSFRGNITPNSSNGIGTFTISKKCNLKGNCMSMLFGDEAADNYSLSGKDYAFYKLFYICFNIVTVSENFLPAKTLKISCYRYMFYGCTSLTTAPELPATILANNCYNSMFADCTSLINAPALPAKTLKISCYYDMFNGCTSLTTAPELPATTLANNCYYSMFYGCTSLTTAPKLPATTLANYCYNSMFNGCKNLTTAPALPAKTLKISCYYGMFNGCTKLNYIKMLATDISASYCLYYWVNSVASSGTFVKNPAMNSLPTGEHGIPSGWTVQNATS